MKRFLFLFLLLSMLTNYGTIMGERYSRDGLVEINSRSLPGDVNGDGQVTAADVTALYDVLLNIDYSNVVNGDQNGDNQITAADITAVYDVLLGNYTPSVEFEVNGVKFKMVEVVGGTFMMGSNNGASVDQAHQVTVDGFAIGQTEVTIGLWKAVMGSSPSYFGGDNHPVEQVSWNDCQLFLAKLNQMLPIDGCEFRLPTEAEWEFAARGGNKSRGYLYAGSNIIGEVAWYEGNSYNITHDVATKAPNELGIYDMSGNVEEWCYDWKGSYPTEPQVDPTGPMSGYDRVLRGGYYSTGPTKCQVFYRDGWGMNDKDKEIGFRLVLYEKRPYTEYYVNGVTLRMVEVEGGTFMMGATPEQSNQGVTPWADESPVHQVTLSSYSIGQTEVTQALWQAVMGDNPSYFNEYGNPDYSSEHEGYYEPDLRRPVESVSWNNCQEFITRLNQITGKNFRLPTEAEWEFAARGGNKSQGYQYSGGVNIGPVAWYVSNAWLGDSQVYGTQPVATKKPNELGIYDMSGNVFEWCQDWYGYYSEGPQTNPTGPASGRYRIHRGGSWKSDREYCRVAFRKTYLQIEPYFHSENYMGFRLAM